MTDDAQNDFEAGQAAYEEENYAEAAKLFKKAAEQGDADAQNILGLMYEEGKGVVRDYEEAVKWFRKSAAQGHVEAQVFLSAMYAEGQGVMKDNAEAYKWALVAQANGSEEAKKLVERLELALSPVKFLGESSHTKISTIQKEAAALHAEIEKNKK